MEFATRDFDAAINIRRCAVLKRRPEELTRANFVGQPLKLEVDTEKLKPIARVGRKMARRRLRMGRYIYPPWL